MLSATMICSALAPCRRRWVGVEDDAETNDAGSELSLSRDNQGRQLGGHPFNVKLMASTKRT